MLAPFKVLLIALAIIIVLLFSTGLVSVKSEGFACAGGWVTGFQERTEVFHYGPVRIFAYPFKRECPEERRYDPSDIEACQDTGFCTLPKTSNTTYELTTVE